MSQCYRVSLKSTVSRVVKAEDSICYPIELTPILPPEEMNDLLKAQLKQGGWRAQDPGETDFTAAGPAGETLTIHLETMELTANVSREKTITVEAIASAAADSRRAANASAGAQLRSEEQALGEQIENAGKRELQKEVTTRLAESEAARRRQINELLQKVYAESLKKKAGQLGEIMEIAETTSPEGNYELTIRIEQ